MKDISEYEFELVKVKALLETDEEIEVYLKMIRKYRIKESIFCYRCAICEEETENNKNEKKQDANLNKVLISELNKRRFQQSIFLEIENNKGQMIETGTQISFLDVSDYIRAEKNNENRYEQLFNYFDEKSDDVLLIGIKTHPFNK